MRKSNWKNEEDYDYTKTLTAEGWAWEFLRRNPDYQNDYKSLRELLGRLEKEYGPLDELNLFQRCEVPGLFVFEPERHEGESVGQWNGRCVLQNLERKKSHISHWHAEQWGIIGPMPNPEARGTGKGDSRFKFETKLRLPLWVSLEECRNYYKDEYTPDYPLVLIPFDLRYDLKKQAHEVVMALSSIKKNLKQIKPSLFSASCHHTDKWIDYLRALDADSEGATAIEIGEVLFSDSYAPDDKKSKRDAAYEVLERAKEYRDFKYREIPSINKEVFIDEEKIRKRKALKKRKLGP